MALRKFMLQLAAALSLLPLLACITSAADTPANVAGTWNIKLSGEAGSANQTIELKQDGGKITGTFKGPRQSGPLEGTVDGNTMKGTMSGRGKTGNWTAERAK